VFVLVTEVQVADQKNSEGIPGNASTATSVRPTPLRSMRAKLLRGSRVQSRYFCRQLTIQQPNHIFAERNFRTARLPSMRMSGTCHRLVSYNLTRLAMGPNRWISHPYLRVLHKVRSPFSLLPCNLTSVSQKKSERKNEII